MQAWFLRSIRAGGGRLRRGALLWLSFVAIAALALPQGAIAAPGDIKTVAGGSIGNGYSLFGTIRWPADVAYNPAGDKLYIVDRIDHRVRVVSDPFSQLSTVAGTGVGGFSGDGGPATAAQLCFPDGVTVDAAGNVYIADMGNNRIRKINTAGIISTIAGTAAQGFAGDGGPAVTAQLNMPRGVAVAANGDVYIADSGNGRIRRIAASTGIITTVAGGGIFDGVGTTGDFGPATSASLQNPVEVAVRPSGGFYIADARNVLGTPSGIVFFVNTSGNISRTAGCGQPFDCGVNDGAPGQFSMLVSPMDVSVDVAGLLYIADAGDHRIRVVSTSGTISTVAGNGNCCSAAGDGGPAKKAILDSPEAASPHPNRVTFSIADTGNFKIRRVHLGDIGPTILAFGDSGPATNAWITQPRAVATDSTGLMYVVDSIGRLRKVTTPHPLAHILTLVGDEPLPGYPDAFFAQPIDVTVDSFDQPIFTDANRDRVFRFAGVQSLEVITSAIADPGAVAAGKTGFLTPAEAGNPLNSKPVIFVAEGVFNPPAPSPANRVFAVSKGKAPVRLVGDGTCGATGDGGPSSMARICGVGGMATDVFGNLYIASANRVRKIIFGADGIFNGADDIISTVVGPLAVDIRDVSIGPAGSLYLVLSNHSVVKFTGPLTTVAGNGTVGFSGDGGPGTAAQLSDPSSVAFDPVSGRVYIADTGNNRVRSLEP